MSEFEIASITAAAMANFLTAFTVFLSIVTAYIVAAFVAGSRLTKLQLVIVNLSFLIATSILGYLVVAAFRRFYSSAIAKSNFNPEGGPLAIDFTCPLGMLIVIFIAGCLIFMHTIRKETQSERDQPLLEK
jgi:hypothetical protein